MPPPTVVIAPQQRRPRVHYPDGLGEAGECLYVKQPADMLGKRLTTDGRAVEIVDRVEREVGVIASDETIDRWGDVIRVNGWELDNYKKHPVLLWAHRSGDPFIGRVVETSIDKKQKQLLATVRLLSEGVNSFVDAIWRAFLDTGLFAVSVGFLPTKMPEDREDEDGHWLGWEFVGQELLELSAVNVPANPAALALKKHLSPEHFARLFTVPSGLQAARARLELERLRVPMTGRGK